MTEFIIPSAHASLDRPIKTVRDVLAMSSVRLGDPQVLASHEALDTGVRWVHIASGAGVASLLDGGELLLTTGTGWPDQDEGLLHEVNDLINANIAALFIELGARFASIPEVIIDICEKRNVALVALNTVTPFVQITEQVHRAILHEQSTALQARDEVQAMLTRLGLNRAPVDYVIEQLAEVLRAPVVLENTLGEVMSWADPSPGAQPSRVLAAWPRNLADALNPLWNAVSVEARDARWGTLIACDGPPHPAGRQTVLELGAVALALGRLADPMQQTNRWMNTNAKRLLDDLLHSRYNSDEEMRVQLAAAGMSFSGGDLFAFSLELDGASAPVLGQEAMMLQALQHATHDGGKLLSTEPTVHEPRLLGILQMRNRTVAKDGLAQFLRARLDEALDLIVGQDADSAQRGTSPPRLRLTIGPPASNTAELVTSLEMASAVTPFVTTIEGSRVRIAEIAKQPLIYLVSELRSDARLERFSRSVLAPLIDFDRQHSADLVRVLEAYTRHPTNRSEAARAANLSRSVFYQRIALIEEILEADLSNGTTIATLFLAIAAATPVSQSL